MDFPLNDKKAVIHTTDKESYCFQFLLSINMYNGLKKPIQFFIFTTTYYNKEMNLSRKSFQFLEIHFTMHISQLYSINYFVGRNPPTELHTYLCRHHNSIFQ